MRTMTSWVKVPGQNTWETSPLPHASCAVSFRPLSSISFAWKEEERRPCELQGDPAWKLRSEVRRCPRVKQAPWGVAHLLGNLMEYKRLM